MTLKFSFFVFALHTWTPYWHQKSTAKLHLTKENPGWEIRLALFVILVLFTDPGCCSTENSNKQEFCFLLLLSKNHAAAIFNMWFCLQFKVYMLSGIYDLWGLLKDCWIISKKCFIPEILPVCRCMVSVQQQCFAKLQSEMNQLARPPACQPSHPAKTSDRSPLLLFHNSCYTSSFYITSHKYTQDKSEREGWIPPLLLSIRNSEKQKKLACNRGWILTLSPYSTFTSLL